MPSAPPEQLTVEREHSGERLDRYLLRKLPGVSREQVEGWIESGAVTIRGKRCKPLRRIHAGDLIDIARPAPRAAAPAPKVPELRVLFESAAVVAVDKPAGLNVEPDPAGRFPSVVGALARQLPGWDVGGKAEPGVVHRLDKETTGVLLLARTDAAAGALEQAFQQGRIEKTYLAAVLGEAPPEARLETPYARDPRDPRLYTTRVKSPRRAELRYRTLRSREGVSILEVQLLTGRTHQIRVQLADAGLPVLGDPIYGPREARAHPAAPARQALHAFRLAFPDPASGQTIRLESPVPEDLARVLQRIHP